MLTDTYMMFRHAHIYTQYVKTKIQINCTHTPILFKSARTHTHTRARTSAQLAHLADMYTRFNTPFYALTHTRPHTHAVHLSGKTGTHKLELRILTHDRCVFHSSTWCSVLQCVAVCCGVLQCVAVCCSVLQCVAVCYSVLQCGVVRCQSVRCVAHSMNKPCRTYQ